ncbi:hypothetical protein ETU08_01870 [Apibacter muscae]|uniref:Uncharacterized protein n=1 Tax=Apibacter muscae TaxID=2509004 RepID=A0A563DKB8_9FLAO|nr:hypothetical protein [Apibacter muscae]TWP30532.1 hypothetical protein ETU09_00595 [Apibacter muscae]TWP31253.1 hypothetical protein ETU08_01870 [Apibacter muscae]
MKIQYSQKQQIFRLLPEEIKKDKDLRSDFISDFTDGRITSTKELTNDEANNLIVSLKGDYSYFGYFDKDNKQHAQIRRICYDLGWTTYSKKAGKSVADVNKLGIFIVSKKSPVRKPLKQMTSKETSKLIIALEGVLNSTYKK